MLNKIKKYIIDNQLFTSDDVILLAVSGGLDSMCLGHLLHTLGQPFAVAHVNFQLRGAASNADADWVEAAAARWGVPYHGCVADTQAVMAAEGWGVQEAARQIRYDFFEKIRQEFDYQYIATAHHATDNTETQVFHWLKGAGLRGLRGMLPKQGRVVRPLLGTTRAQLAQYAALAGIAHREDASNAKDVYARNYIRHHILPHFSAINPDFESKMADSRLFLTEAEALVAHLLPTVYAAVVVQKGAVLSIDTEKMRAWPAPITILHHLLADKGFNTAQLRQMWAVALAGHTGAQFFSDRFRAVFDRKLWLIAPKQADTEGGGVVIPRDSAQIELSGQVLVCTPIEAAQVVVEAQPHLAFFDADALVFPLKLRRWKVGDVFYPLGMQGRRQKLSDFFRQKKLSLLEKEAVWLLTTADDRICWVVGHRIDERFKWHPTAQNCFKIALK